MFDIRMIRMVAGWFFTGLALFLLILAMFAAGNILTLLFGWFMGLVSVAVGGIGIVCLLWDRISLYINGRMIEQLRKWTEDAPRPSAPSNEPNPG